MPWTRRWTGIGAPTNRIRPTVPGAARIGARLAEGADLVMVKPAMGYLDILADVAAHSPAPVAAYQVSGEYSMISAAAERGWIDRRSAVLESLTSIRRAGASIVLTYWAAEVAGWVKWVGRSVTW